MRVPRARQRYRSLLNAVTVLSAPGEGGEGGRLPLNFPAPPAIGGSSGGPDSAPGVFGDMAPGSDAVLLRRER